MDGAGWAPAVGAVAASWLMFQPRVPQEALLADTLPSLPWLRAPRDPPPCRPGSPPTATAAEGRQARVSGSPCPREPPWAPARWPAAGVVLLHLLLAAVAGGGKSPFSEGQWRGASRCCGNCGATMAASSPGLLASPAEGEAQGVGRVISKLIQPGAGRGKSQWAGSCWGHGSPEVGSVLAGGHLGSG